MEHDAKILTAGKRIGRPAAMALVTDETDRQYLITETVLVTVTLFLLNRYFVGVAKGLGIEALGQRHENLGGYAPQTLQALIIPHRGIT